jgi:hypothetical protein
VYRFNNKDPWVVGGLDALLIMFDMSRISMKDVSGLYRVVRDHDAENVPATVLGGLNCCYDLKFRRSELMMVWNEKRSFHFFPLDVRRRYNVDTALLSLLCRLTGHSREDLELKEWNEGNDGDDDLWLAKTRLTMK